MKIAASHCAGKQEIVNVRDLKKTSTNMPPDAEPTAKNRFLLHFDAFSFIYTNMHVNKCSSSEVLKHIRVHTNICMLRVNIIEVVALSLLLLGTLAEDALFDWLAC